MSESCASERPENDEGYDGAAERSATDLCTFGVQIPIVEARRAADSPLGIEDNRSFNEAKFSKLGMSFIL